MKCPHCGQETDGWREYSATSWLVWLRQQNIEAVLVFNSGERIIKKVEINQAPLMFIVNATVDSSNGRLIRFSLRIGESILMSHDVELKGIDKYVIINPKSGGMCGIEIQTKDLLEFCFNAGLHP